MRWVVDDIIEYLKQKMEIYSIETTPFYTEVTGKFYPPADKTFEEIREFFKTNESTPFFSTRGDDHVVRFGVFKRRIGRPRYWLNILLFCATLVSIVFGYFIYFGNFKSGIIFALGLITILTSHELGHYFVSWKAGMATSLPYFIPMPLNFIGTLGAIITMRSIVPNRRTLLKIGMAGPVTGFVIALIVSIIGFALSEIKSVSASAGYFVLGDSLLFYLLGKIFYPVIPAGSEIFLHPLAFAGWVGLFVTSMNLVPIGQLDGGHVAYSVLLKRQKLLYIPTILCLVVMGFFWLGWILWGTLAFILARREPPIQDAITPLTLKEKLYAVIPLIMLILTFIPRPFSMSYTK